MVFFWIFAAGMVGLAGSLGYLLLTVAPWFGSTPASGEQEAQR